MKAKNLQNTVGAQGTRAKQKQESRTKSLQENLGKEREQEKGLNTVRVNPGTEDLD